MEVVRSVKFRLFPTKEQENKFRKFVGVSRFTYNFALDLRESVYKESKETLKESYIRKKLREKRDTEEYAWLGEVPEALTKKSVRDLYEAYRNYFRNLKEGKLEKGKGRPKYKKKGKSGKGLRGIK